jgi:hypothetical protein
MKWRRGPARDKRVKELRKLLSQPIKAYQLGGFETPEGRRKIKQETDARIDALFELFDIEEDWDELLRWRQLALCLAGEHFAGCRTLRRGLGGPTATTLEKRSALKRELSEKFERYRQANPRLSQVVAAANFRKRNLDACRTVGWNLPKSIARAMSTMRKNKVVLELGEGEFKHRAV